MIGTPNGHATPTIFEIARVSRIGHAEGILEGQSVAKELRKSLADTKKDQNLLAKGKK